MHVVEGYRSVPREARGAVLAIGNFDGVHRGHQELISTAIRLARELKGPAGVMLFDPHPRAYFQPNRPLFRLTSLARKLELIEALGVDVAAVLKFDAALAALTAEQFVADVLVEGFAIRHVVVGYDFHFGRGRSGSTATLLDHGPAGGFGVTVLEPVQDGGAPFSSSSVRTALARGDIAAAARSLGYHWRVAGRVVGGAKRGTGMGFPTANIHLDPGTQLAFGIYAVRVHVGSRVLDGAAYWGTRPTFDAGLPVLEVFLLDFDGNLYGETIAIEFIDFVRPDAKFEDGAALALQMQRDCDRAREQLAANRAADPIAGLPLARR